MPAQKVACGWRANCSATMKALPYDVSKQTAHGRASKPGDLVGVTYLLLQVVVEVYIADSYARRRRISPGLFATVTRGAIAEPIHNSQSHSPLARRCSGPPLALS